MLKKYLMPLMISVLMIPTVCRHTFGFTPGAVRIIVQDFYSAEPIADARVVMMPGNYTGTTDAQGTIVFSDITPYRNYSVTVASEGHVESKYGDGRTGFVWVKTGKTTDVLTPLKKPSAIRGRVSSGSGPVSGAMVVALEERLDLIETVAATHTDANGDYELARVPEGDYSVCAVADSYSQSCQPMQIAADEQLEQDFTIQPGISLLSFNISAAQTFYGNSVSVSPDNLIYFYNPRYTIVMDKPEGAELPKSSSSSFTPTLPGAYTFAMMVIDFNGVGREVIQTIEMVNAPPAAFPAIIPGPSELPLLYDNGTRYAASSGLAGVRPGDTVYLRGWGEDYNLPSPEQYNSATPLFDIYGNKNGDWSQSAFSFAWALQDADGNDLTDLLADPSAENTSFTVPVGARPSDTYIARLTITGDAGLAGKPSEVTAYVAEEAGTEACAACHIGTAAAYRQTRHAQMNVGCEDCHGPGSLHNGDFRRISVTHWPGMCGRCHDQFAQWQKSRHSDPLAFGHSEVNAALRGNCYKCHYTEGFIQAAKSGSFDAYRFPFGIDVPVDTPNVGCDVCHDPHNQSAENPVGIRTGTAASLCVTCHEKKWQNATYSAEADKIGNGFHWSDYSQYQGSGNQHRMDKGCVTCHMSTEIADTDNNSVRLVGGHCLRMRDMGPDNDPGTADDILNITACQSCHAGLATFDRNGVQTRVKAKLEELGSLLRADNHGFMPPFQPGKCATCHRGSNLPFIDETAENTLKHAYLNYSLILNDRSYGVHNPGYIERLLDDSLAAIKHFESISLSAYTATAGSFSVTLRWSTAHEQGISGFNIMRSASADGEYTRVNAAAIPAIGTAAQGDSYEYVDSDVINGVPYFYKLQDLAADGSATDHAAISATPRLIHLLWPMTTQPAAQVKAQAGQKPSECTRAVPACPL